MSRSRSGKTGSVPGVPGVPASADLHRLALERRQARMAERATEPVMPTAAEPERGATTTVVPVMGMTCRTCEVRIQRYVGRLPGVERVTASAVHGRVHVESSAPIPSAALAAAIRAAGYEVGATPWLERNPDVWLTALFGVVLLAAFVLVAKVTGLDSLASGAGSASLGTGGLAVALLLGLAAGVSTCMALVGGLVLALSASFEAAQAAGSSRRGVMARMRPSLVFMSGRITGYAFVGALLGALGAGITFPPVVLGGMMIAVAVLMTLVGARLTGLSPRIAAWSPTLPVGLARSLGMTQGATQDGTGAYSDGRAALLGAATFFMPCGFTQAVQVYALSTGSPLIAGATMAVFAIGTAPGLLGLAGLPAIVPASVRPTLLRVVGVVVIGFALVNGSAGIRLAGLGLPTFGTQSAAGPVSTTITGGVQGLTTFQAADGYSPGNVTIYAGIPTRWTIQSSTVATCAASLVVPKLGIQTLLHVGDNTFELPAQKAGTIDYSCSMGMYGGRITVVDRPTGVVNR